MKKWLTAAMIAALMAYATPSVEISNKKPVKKPIKRSMPRYAAVDRHSVLVHEFSAKEFDFYTVVEPVGRTLDYIINKYRDADLILVGGYHDRATRTMVGRVNNNGRTLSNGIWPDEDAKLSYRAGQFKITDSIEDIANDLEICDLPYLVKNDKICLNKNRKINPDGNTARTAFGIKKNGNNLIVLYTGKIGGLAKLMLRFGCGDAVALDGGTNRAYWYRGVARKREHDYSNLKNVLIGRRRQ